MPSSHRSALPIVACLTSALGLGVGLSVGALVFVGVIDVPWDSAAWPALSAFGLVPFSLAASILSAVSTFTHRDWRSVLALLLGLAAIVVAILTTLLILVASAANNPV